MKMNITVITRGRLKSYHTSFKKACLCYGWDYNVAIKGGTPKVWNGYKITRVETDTSIVDLRILDLLEKNPVRAGWPEDNTKDYDYFTAYLGDWNIEGSISISNRDYDIGTHRGTLVETETTLKVDEIGEVINEEGDNVVDSISVDMMNHLIEKIEEAL